MSEFRLLDLTLFTDRDLGTRIFPEILRSQGLTVEIHDDFFGDTTPDEEWLAFVGEKGWIALTRNKKIRYNPIERDAVFYAGVPLFVMRGRWRHDDLARGFTENISNIERFLSRHSPPFIAHVYLPSKSKPNGRVALKLSHQEWLRTMKS